MTLAITALLFLAEKCIPRRTVPITKSLTILRNRFSFPSPNEPYCVNVTVPHVSISLVSLPDARMEVYRSAPGSSLALIRNESLSSSRIRIIDFGTDTGLLGFQSQKKTELNYNVVKFPEHCASRITSMLSTDSFRLDGDCRFDGCLRPSSSLCYFHVPLVCRLFDWPWTDSHLWFLIHKYQASLRGRKQQLLLSKIEPSPIRRCK
jgi:hypothetical protein